MKILHVIHEIICVYWISKLSNAKYLKVAVSVEKKSLDILKINSMADWLKKKLRINFGEASVLWLAWTIAANLSLRNLM